MDWYTAASHVLFAVTVTYSLIVLVNSEIARRAVVVDEVVVAWAGCCSAVRILKRILILDRERAVAIRRDLAENLLVAAGIVQILAHDVDVFVAFAVVLGEDILLRRLLTAQREHKLLLVLSIDFQLYDRAVVADRLGCFDTLSLDVAPQLEFAVGTFLFIIFTFSRVFAGVLIPPLLCRGVARCAGQLQVDGAAE